MKHKTDKIAKQPFFILTVVVCLVLLFVVIFVLFRISRRSNLRRYLKNDVEIELGTHFTVDDFLTESVDKAYIDMNFDLFDSVGDYKVKIKVQGETFYSNLKVVDTTNPFLEVRNLTVYSDEPLPEARDFITRIYELSDYVIEPIELVNEVSEQEVLIRVRDVSGNFSSKKAQLTILDANVGPTFQGIYPIEIEIGQNIDILEGVHAITHDMEEVSFHVNDSKVNYSRVGTYEIVYTAVDLKGNQSVVKRPITIKKKEKSYLISNFPTSLEDAVFDSSLLSFYRMLQFYQVDVSLSQLVEDISKGNSLRLENQTLYGPDPEVEYVGNPLDSTGYGVYQQPLLEVSKKYRDGWIDYTGASLDEVLLLVKSKIPVQVWVTKDLETPNLCLHWQYQEKQIDWYCNMQSVVIVGYHADTIFVSVPDSTEIVAYPRSQFDEIYRFFGKRSLYFNS